MDSKKRSQVSFDDDSADIDLEDLLKASPQPKLTSQQKQQSVSVGEKTGFVSREPKAKKERKRSPYVIQKNTKMRLGMPELLNDLTKAIGFHSDQETIEKGILALIEYYKQDELRQRFKELCK